RCTSVSRRCGVSHPDRTGSIPRACLQSRVRPLPRNMGNQAIADLCRDCSSVFAARGDDDRRKFVGQREYLCVLHHEISSTMAFDTAFPQHANDVDCFLQFFLTDFRRRPLSSDYMLVKVFTGADSEKKPAGPSLTLQ